MTSLLSGLQLLVVEDDDDFREMLTLVLEARGARVTAAASVPEAFALFVGLKPDAVLSDIEMPNLSGHALVRRIRALPDTLGALTPIIAVSAQARACERKGEGGFSAYLSKPIDEERLVSMVLELCDTHDGAADAS